MPNAARNSCRVIRHYISIEYECPKTNTKHSVKIKSPRIERNIHYGDFSEFCLEVPCKSCGASHCFEVSV